MAEFFGMKYLWDGGRTTRDLEWQMLLDGVNDVDVSKGMLSCLDTYHHLDENQILTTRII